MIKWTIAVVFASAVFALDTYTADNTVDSNAKVAVLKILLAHSTKAPTVPLKVRAVIFDEAPSWTTEQVEKEVKSQMDFVPPGTPTAVLAEHENSIRNAVKSATSGRRWYICEETRGKKVVRLDVKEYYTNEPPAIDHVKPADELFEVSYINCYEGHQLPYQAARITPSASEVLLDNSTQPVKYGLWNLFVAQHLEGKSAMRLAVLVGGILPPLEIEKLIQDHGLENSDILTSISFDTDKASSLVYGLVPNLKITTKNSGGSWEIALDAVGATTVKTEWKINEALPYLVSRTAITTPDGVVYNSERSGITDLGFPTEWKTEERSGDGVVSRRTIRIISATTNVNPEGAFTTKWPSGYKVWSRNPNGVVTPVSGITNWSGIQSPFLKGASGPKPLGLGRFAWVLIAIGQLVLFIYFFVRKNKSK